MNGLIFLLFMAALQFWPLGGDMLPFHLLCVTLRPNKQFNEEMMMMSVLNECSSPQNTFIRLVLNS